MSVNPSPAGGFAGQFFDNNGVILSGGKIFTYAAGTTTPQATYTSALGNTAHANPIILDSAGRVPGGEIWLTDGVDYKFVIETATGSLLGTYDNITGINSILAELASTAVGEGASLVGIHDAGNYYTSTTVEGALQELGDALDLGVSAYFTNPLEFSGSASVGTGTLSSYTPSAVNGITALNAAAAHAVLTGKTLVIPAPSYSISSTWTIPRGCKVVFQGVLHGLTVTGPLIQIGAGGTTPVMMPATRVQGAMVGGSASLEAVLITNAQAIFWDGLVPVAGASFLRMARFRWTWGSSYQNFYSYVNDAENTTTVTGDCFVFGRNCNNCLFDNFYTSNVADGTAYLIDCDFGESPVDSQTTTQGPTFNNIAAQGMRRGVWIRRGTGVSIRGLYLEECPTPIIFGDVADISGVKLADNCNITGGYCVAAVSTHPYYSDGRAAIDFNYARSCRVSGIEWSCCFGALEWASVAVTGGAGTGARAVAVVNRSGVIIGAYWIEEGSGYTGTPTLTVTAGSPGGTPAGGSGGVLTATGIPVANGAITITNPGSGYGAALPYFPSVARYHTSYDCEFDGMFSSMPSLAVGLQQPTWPLVTRAVGALPQCGINGKVYSRFGPNPTDGSPALLVRGESGATSHIHYICSLRGNLTGINENRPFIPSEL